MLGDVERLGYAPLLYQVMFAHGDWLDAAGTPEQARPFIEQALRGALAVRDDKTAARALNNCSWPTATQHR